MRAAGLLALLGLGCAGPAPEPPPVDPVHRAMLVADGFREAGPELAARLDRAAAFAVFPDVEDGLEGFADGVHECLHAGFLFRADGAPEPVRLRCTEPPPAPAGVAYHALVVLDAAADLERLAAGGLELHGVPHRSPHDGDGPLPAPGGPWVVTSVRGGLFFDARDGHQVLEPAVDR